MKKIADRSHFIRRVFVISTAALLLQFVGSPVQNSNSSRGGGGIAVAQAQNPPTRDWGAATSSLTVGTHVLGACFYDLTNTAACSLTFNNKGPVVLTVTPTLYNLAGQVRSEAPLSVPANAQYIVDLRDWVPVGDTQFERGSIQLTYTGEELRLGAQVRFWRQALSTGFDEQLVDYSSKFASTTLQSSWWLPSTSSKLEVALSNTSSAQTSVTLTVARKGAASVAPSYTLAPHETKLLNIQTDVLSGGALTLLGGLTVTHNGLPGGIMARGMVTLGSVGYSVPLDFVDPSMIKSSTLHGAGIRIASVGGQELSAFGVIRNLGASSSTITGRIRYTTTGGTTNILQFAPFTVAAGDVQLIQPLSVLTLSQKNSVSVAGCEIEYSTPPGTVVASMQTVSGNQTHVFRVPLLDPQGQQSSTGGYPWLITSTSSTVVYLKNVTTSSQYYALQLNFSGGIYSPGQRIIGPGQTVLVDVKALRDQQTADEEGYKIPLAAVKGQVQWSMDGPDNLVIIGRAEQIDATNGLSSTYACQNCCPDDFYSASGTPDPMDGIPGFSFQLSTLVTTTNCYGTAHQRIIDYFSRWLSPANPFSASNSSIASINPNTGLVTFGQTLGSSFVATTVRDREWVPTPAGCHLIESPFTDQTPVSNQNPTLEIMRDGIPILPGDNPSGEVGDLFRLSASVGPGSLVASSFSYAWSVQGQTYSDWTVSDTGCQTVPAALNGRNIVYFWPYPSGSGGYSVTVTASSSGEGTSTPPPVTVNFQITRPSFDVLNGDARPSWFGPFGVGHVEIQNGIFTDAVYLGTYTNAGVNFQIKNHNNPNDSVPGQFAWGQISNTTTRRIRKSNGDWYRLAMPDNVIDGHFPYSAVRQDLADSPAQPYIKTVAGSNTNNVECQVNEIFTAFVMWHSNEPGAKWVPIAYVNWGWAGSGVKNSSGVWTAVAGGGPLTPQPEITYATDYPATWHGSNVPIATEPTDKYWKKE